MLKSFPEICFVVLKSVFLPIRKLELNTFEMLMQVSLDDVRPYASFRAPDTDNNLIILDNFRNVAFTGKTLQLGFMLCCYCNRGGASFVLNGKAYEMGPGDFLVGFGEQVFEKCRPRTFVGVLS